MWKFIGSISDVPTDRDLHLAVLTGMKYTPSSFPVAVRTARGFTPQLGDLSR